MSPYTDIDQFLDGSTYDLSDDVLGGTGGDSNVPLTQLFDRTRYLYNRIGIIDTLEVTGNYTWSIADFNKAFVVVVAANTSFALPAASSVPKGHIIRVSARITYPSGIPKALTIDNGTIKDGVTDRTNMYLHDGETIWLMAASVGNVATTPDHWIIVNGFDKHLLAGESFGARKSMKNTLVCDGTLYNRADVPRLAEFALSLTNNQALVSDAIWLSIAGTAPRYRGCFSSGNGTTTIRVPDERGLFDRYLDLGRGLDNSRLHNFAGGFEDQSVQQHTHPHLRTRTDQVGTRYENNTLRNGGDRGLWTGDVTNTGNNAGSAFTQTQGKNIGKIPLVRI